MSFILRETVAIINLALSDLDIEVLENRDILHAVSKNEHFYYSDRDVHRAKAIVKTMRNENLSLEAAVDRLSNRRVPV